jgi:hypothetical protein
MQRWRRHVGILVAAAATCAFASAAVAMGAPGAPAIVSPKPGAQVTAGNIRLVVRDTTEPKGFDVFVQISRQRKLNRFGHLAACNNLGKGCDFLILSRWKGHSGEWTYSFSSPVGFPGFWATTPGRYYWQALHVNCRVTHKDSCHVTSTIASFEVG